MVVNILIASISCERLLLGIITTREDHLLDKITGGGGSNTFFGLTFQSVGPLYSLFHGFWQSFVTIGSCNHLMRIISTYVGNTKKSEIS